MAADFLREKAITKYNNMVQAGRWKRSEDPSSKIISALTTQISDLQKQVTLFKVLQTIAGPNKNKNL